MNRCLYCHYTRISRCTTKMHAFLDGITSPIYFNEEGFLIPMSAFTRVSNNLPNNLTCHSWYYVDLKEKHALFCGFYLKKSNSPPNLSFLPFFDMVGVTGIKNVWNSTIYWQQDYIFKFRMQCDAFTFGSKLLYNVTLNRNWLNFQSIHIQEKLILKLKL